MINARDILRHRDPFLYVETFSLVKNVAIARIDVGRLNDLEFFSKRFVSLFFAECVTQLAGCLVRCGDAVSSGKFGYLCTIEQFHTEVDAPRSKHVLCEAKLLSNRLNFVGFSGTVFFEEAERVQVRGTIALVDEKLHIAERRNSKPAAAHAAIVCLGATMPAQILGPIQSIQLLDDSIAVLVFVDPAARFFKGHFPDQPVTPGVVLADAMAEVALMLHDRQGYEVGIRVQVEAAGLTFSKLVTPGATLSIVARKAADWELRQWISVTVLEKGRRCARGKFRFSAP